jgi:polar amino acid transport system substrate-binding protein
LRHALVLNRQRFAAMAKGRTVEEVLREYTGTLGVIAGSSYVGYAQRKFPKAQIVEYPGWPEVVAAVKDGAITAAYRDEFEIKRLPAKDPKISLTVRTVTLKDTRDVLAIAVRPGDTQLLYFVNLLLSDPVETLSVDLIFKNFADWL